MRRRACLAWSGPNQARNTNGYSQSVTSADLKGTLYEFARRIFGEQRQVRSRCDYFPFVEPGVDMSNSNFKDPETVKRPINHNEVWMEILGARIVHPKDLESAGLHPQLYPHTSPSAWTRAHGDAQARHGGHPPLLLQRPALPQPVLVRMLYYRPKSRGAADATANEERRRLCDA